MSHSFSRRDLILSSATLGLSAIGRRAEPAPTSAQAANRQTTRRAVTRGRLRQSVSRWCYQKIALPDLCRAIAALGVPAIDLLEPQDWLVARDHGLVCSMGYGGGGTIRDGLNDPANHDRIVANLTAAIPKAAAAGVPNLITFFGNRQGRNDRESIDNCVKGLNRLKGVAEDEGVTICVELLNSKVDHPDYQGDRTAFGVEIVSAVASPRVKLLYDIYHMQIMEGDVIRTITENWDYIAHFHTGGNPGRNEIDETQELNYKAICTAIVAKGFTGYLAQEFIPKRDPVTSLSQAFRICDV
jgi:hydroxypyruvate isomerase